MNELLCTSLSKWEGCFLAAAIENKCPSALALLPPAVILKLQQSLEELERLPDTWVRCFCALLLDEERL